MRECLADGVKKILWVCGPKDGRMLSPSPPCCRFFLDSFDLLRIATSMRAQGHLPASLALWAVENPMVNPVERLARKADVGAEVVLTQPPLLNRASERWFEDAHKRGLHKQLKVSDCSLWSVGSTGSSLRHLRRCSPLVKGPVHTCDVALRW